ncbi:MAG TPA: hypothetical protein VGA42_05695 [Gemmatimonadales bacterium]
MTRVAAVLLLLLQLRPVAGMALCLHQAAAAEECAGSMDEMPADSRGSSQPDLPLGSGVPAHECSFAEVCNTPVPAILELPAILSLAVAQIDPAVSRTPSLRGADPLPPPPPPPNA